MKSMENMNGVAHVGDYNIIKIFKNRVEDLRIMNKSKNTKNHQNRIVNGVHLYGHADDYIPPKEENLLKKLEWFRDQKLGIFFHFGLYSEIGGLVSWMLSDEDKAWSYHDLNWDDPKECQKQYKQLNRSFNPIRMRPDEWAQIAKLSGMKYLIMTTKHHDGFCLWDTRLTDYKVTSKECPFSQHKYADIIKNVFEAFRKEDMGLAAYFSKADWSSPYYWNPTFAKQETSRHANYDVDKHPELWKKFVEFTHDQIMELVDGYGPFDILWLDAGWVCPQTGEDIALDKLAAKARAVIPDLLFVDRTVGGAWENYFTPEGIVPEHVLDIPWESCITLDQGGWGYTYEPNYKSQKEVIHLLIEIVAKGGNLALGVGPQPDGRIPQEATKLLLGLGKWLQINGEAIYKTRVCAPYFIKPWAFTKNEKYIYAIRMNQPQEDFRSIQWNIPLDQTAFEGSSCIVKKVTLLSNGCSLNFKQINNELHIIMTENMWTAAMDDATVFRLEFALSQEQ